MSAAFAELGEIAEFVNGAAFKPDDWCDEGMRIIRIQNLTDSSKPFNRTTRKVARKLYVRPGDLLVSWSASLGVFEWEGPDVAVLNQHIFRVLPDETKVNKRYLRYGLERALREMQRHLHGATMQHVNRAEFLSTRLHLPPLPEQHRIAAILDKADALRTKRRTTLAHLDTLTHSIFIDMFGDPATNPKQWRIQRVGDVADVQGGLQLSSARKTLPIELPYLRVANVMRGFLSLNEIKTMRVTESEARRTQLARYDFLIVEGHGNPSEIGRGALWDGSIQPCIHQNHLIRVRFDHAKVLPEFSAYYLNSPGGRRHLLRSGKTTSGLNTISVSEVRSTPLATPPVHLQKEFARRMDAIHGVTQAQRRGSVALDALFASLQHRAFNGSL